MKLQDQILKLSTDNSSAHTSNTLAINAVSDAILSSESVVKESVREVMVSALPISSGQASAALSYSNILKQNVGGTITMPLKMHMYRSLSKPYWFTYLKLIRLSGKFQTLEGRLGRVQ